MKEWYDKEYFDSKNKNMHYEPRLYNITKIVQRYNPKNVLDVGCGIGIMVKRLRKMGIDAVGIDFSPYAGKEIPKYFIQAEADNLPYSDNSFDLILATDFFEHIAEEDIGQVYPEMKRVGKNILAIISFKKEKGKIDTHLTVKPREWWEKKLPEVEIIK